MRTLFVFIDESGNFDFSPKGTKYFVLSAVSTLNPLGKERLEEIKYNLMKNGNDLEYFHTAEDKQSVRDLVYTFIKNMEDIEIDSVIVQKNKANPSLYISEKNTQLADYCCWAIYKKWTNGGIRPYNAVNKENKIKSEFDIFKTGKTIYYNYPT